MRYPLIVAFAALVVYGLVAAFTSGSASAPGALRVALSAVLVPAVLAPLLIWGGRRRRRTTNRGRPRPDPHQARSPADLGPRIRAAGFGDYADRLDRARASGATANEFLMEVLMILRELLHEHPDLPRDLDDQVHRMVGDLSALLN